MKKSIMNKKSKIEEMKVEYDFSNGVGGKHHVAYNEGTNIIYLDNDVREHFKDSQAVNHALRMLINLAEKEIHLN